MTPKQEVEELMNEGIAFVKKMLREHGGCHPFGVVRKSDGQVQHVGASNGLDYPAAKDLIAILRKSYRQEAEVSHYEATGLFYDVRIAPPGTEHKTDAVQVELEHRSGYCANVFFPYSRDAKGHLVFGEIFATKRDGTVFLPTDDRAV